MPTDYFDINKFLKGKFSIECKEIVLRSNSGDIDFFKGPGVMSIDASGHMSYKIYNQLPISDEQRNFITIFRNFPNDKAIPCILDAKDYSGNDWNGGWTIPRAVLFLGTKSFIIFGEIDRLDTIIQINKKRTQTSTELYYINYPRLPFDIPHEITTKNGKEIVSNTVYYNGKHAELDGFPIDFEENKEAEYLKVNAVNHDNFMPPFVENWINESLIVCTAQLLKPKIIIRHLENQDLISISANIDRKKCKLLSPFLNFGINEIEFWKFFNTYLHFCIRNNNFEYMDLTIGFYELCSVSCNTFKNFMCILSTYIEFCLGQIFTGTKINNDNIGKLHDYILDCKFLKDDAYLKNRALGLISMLNTPSNSQRLRTLLHDKIITKEQMKSWEEMRPFFAHGNVINYSKSDNFNDSKEHLICLLYRLIFQIIGYKGLTIDFNDTSKKFSFVTFEPSNKNYNNNI